MRLLSLYGVLLSLLLSCGVVEAADLPKPVKQICGHQGECVDANKGKYVVIEYQDFLKMLAMKDHSDKTAKQKTDENVVLVRLTDEQRTVIKLQQDDIQACREIVKSHEQLGETEAQISKAVEAELRKALEGEKRKNWTYFGAGAASGATAVGIIAATIWMSRR